MPCLCESCPGGEGCCARCEDVVHQPQQGRWTAFRVGRLRMKGSIQIPEPLITAQMVLSRRCTATAQQGSGWFLELETGTDPLRPRIGVTLFPARYGDQFDAFSLGHDFAQQLDQAPLAPSIGATPQVEKKRSELIAVKAKGFPGERMVSMHAMDRQIEPCSARETRQFSPLRIIRFSAKWAARFDQKEPSSVDQTIQHPAPLFKQLP